MLLSELVIRDTDSVYCARLHCFVDTNFVFCWQALEGNLVSLPFAISCNVFYTKYTSVLSTDGVGAGFCFHGQEQFLCS